MAVKYTTHVAVMFTDEDGRVITKFVTGVDGSDAFWEAGKPAMKLTEPFAKDVVLGLTWNGYAAAVIKVVNGVTLRNA